MIYIKTGRLIIKNFSQSDWKVLQELILDKEASKYAMYDFPMSPVEKDVKKRAKYFSSYDDFLAICKVNDKIIGWVKKIGDDYSDSRATTGIMDLGYTIHSAEQGKGYATEACKAVINYAFDNLNVKKFTARVSELNEPSHRLLKKLGFEKTGEDIYNFRKTKNGTNIDCLISFFELEKEAWLLKGL